MNVRYRVSISVFEHELVQSTQHPTGLHRGMDCSAWAPLPKAELALPRRVSSTLLQTKDWRCWGSAESYCSEAHPLQIGLLLKYKPSRHEATVRWPSDLHLRKPAWRWEDPQPPRRVRSPKLALPSL